MADFSKWTWGLEQTICSDPTLAVELIRNVREQLELHFWSERDVFAIHLALEEAVMNAIKHGNDRNPRKCVLLSVRLTPFEFWARVEDQGQGFDRAEVADPTRFENLDRPSGRGLTLIENYMDRVDFHSPGNVIEMSKSRTGM